MTENKGGLNIKDYPFAFSIAALIFPTMLGENSGIAHLLVITLVGGLIGSLLTIINPVGIIIREIYWRQKQYDVYPFLYTQPSLIRRILQKNFRAALSTPSISYEQDKMVGMMYFLIILALSVFRTTQSDFTETLRLDDSQIWGIRIGSMVGFILVYTALHYSIKGFIFRKSKKTINHLDRIKTATISNLAVDFANLSNEGYRWKRFFPDHLRIRETLCSGLCMMNKDKLDLEELAKITPKIQEVFVATNNHWDTVHFPTKMLNLYKSAREVSFRYDVSLKVALTWFTNTTNLTPTEFDEPISQLQSSIQSRDWYNATLKTYRITDRLEDFLGDKKIPDEVKPLYEVKKTT